MVFTIIWNIFLRNRLFLFSFVIVVEGGDWMREEQLEQGWKYSLDVKNVQKLAYLDTINISIGGGNIL